MTRTAACAAIAAALVALVAAADGSSRSDGAADSALSSLTAAPAFDETASAKDILAVCRAMVPTNVTIEGHVNRRSRHGTEKAAYRYVLVRKNGGTELRFTDRGGAEVPFEKGGRLLDTDVTWSDLSMDFLWWDDVSFDEQAEAESVTGIICKVILVRNGRRAFRAWIDRRTGALIQANEVWDGKTVREIFCTSLKKFGDKWSPGNIEVGPPGAKYRTKIVVENVR